MSIDTSAPNPPVLTGFSDDSGVVGDGRTSDTTPTLTGTAEAGSTVAIFNGSTQIGTVVATGGNFTFTVPTELANGTYAFSARATDAAGNQSAASASLSVTVDATAPGAPVIGSVSPDSGVAGDGITNTTAAIVSGTAEAGATVTIFSGATAIGTAIANPNGTYSAAVTLNTGSNSLTARATDAAGNVSAASTSVGVTVDTAAPTVTSTAFSVGENQSVAGSLAATDASGPVTFALGTGADSALFALANGNQLRFLAAPNFEAPSDGNTDNVYVVNVVATDAAGNSTSVAINVTVGNVNEAPTAVADQASTNEDNAVVVNVGSNDTDPDAGAVLGVTAATVRGGSAIGSVSFSGGSLTFTPAQDFNGTAIIDYTISDGSLASNSAATVTVNPVNDAPVNGTTIAPQTVAEDNLWVFTVPAGSFSDVDRDTLTLSATLATGDPLPKWLTFTGSTFVGQPPQDFNGTLNLKVTASDGSLTTFQTFTLDVTAVNDAPVVSTVILGQSVAEDNVWTFVLPTSAFTDVDGDTLTLTATLGDGSPLPSWLTFNGTTFSGQPPQDFNGSLSLKVSAADPSSASAAQTFTLTVNPVNDAPVLGTPIAPRASRRTMSGSSPSPPAASPTSTETP